MTHWELRAARVPFALLGLAAFTFSSSWLGLNGRDVVFPNPEHDSWNFFVRIWSDSVVADAIFVGGSILSAVVGFLLARRGPLAYAYAASLALGWATYAVSFSFLSDEVRAPAGAWDSFVFVGGWGWLGLNLVAFAPAATARLLEWEAWSRRIDAPRIGLHVALAFVFLALFALFSGGARHYVTLQELDPDLNPLKRAIATIWVPGSLILAFGGAAVTVLSFHLARRGLRATSTVVSFALHWGLLGFAAMTMFDMEPWAGAPPVAAHLREALFTGLLGLIFAAVAPAAAAWAMERGLGPEEVAAAGEQEAPRTP